MYTAAETRYDRMIYRHCGASGLKLPAISLGLWHNFGEDTPHATKRAICQTAFDRRGIVVVDQGAVEPFRYQAVAVRLLAATCKNAPTEGAKTACCIVSDTR